MLEQILIAIIISAIVVLLAWWRGSLSNSGAAAGMVVGTLTFGLGGWQWGVLLGVFFVTSSVLSHFKESEKLAAAEKFDKGHQRDWGQVVANGGVGALAAMLSVLLASELWYVFFVGVMATVTADTWATELGTLSRRPPRLITNGRLVDVGTSGGVSMLGTLVSFSGGLVLGLVAGLVSARMIIALAVLGAVSGLTGSLFDSLLGATVQRIYYCDVCQKDTERKVHKCGNLTRPWRGWSWLNNDLVNLWASLVGGIMAAGLWVLFLSN